MNNPSHPVPALPSSLLAAAGSAGAGMSPALLQRYNRAISKVVKSAEFGQKMDALGVIPASSTPAQLGARLQATRAAWSQMVQNAGYQPR